MYIVNPLCYKTPPRDGHLSRTGHIGGSYMPVYMVLHGQFKSQESVQISRHFTFRVLLRNLGRVKLKHSGPAYV